MEIFYIALGIVLLIFSLLLNEKEEKRILSAIQTAWLKIDEKIPTIYAWTQALLIASFKLAIQLLDYLFGEKSISLRIVANSIILSLASVFIFSFFGEASSVLYLIVTLLLISLIVFQNRWRGFISLSYLVAIAILIGYSYIMLHDHPGNMRGFIQGVGLSFMGATVISVLETIFSIAISRNVLKRH